MISIKASLSAGFLALASLIVPAAHAGEQPNVLIVGEDADEDTVPRHSRIFNRVNDALRTRMQELGFKVYNETAVTKDITDPGRVRRTDAELISVAQNLTDVPIDVITAFQIYASAQDNAYSDIKQLRIRIVGRMLQVKTGRDLGNFEVAVGPKGLRPIPVNCNADCVLEHVGDEAKPIANEVGAVLAHKLDELTPVVPSDHSDVIKEPAPIAEAAPSAEPSSKPDVDGCTGLSTAFTIVLSGFDPGDVAAIERMIVAFQGYEHHRPLKSQTKYSEYWYETCSDTARLERNMRRLAEAMPGKNRVALIGNKFEIEHIPSVTKR